MEALDIGLIPELRNDFPSEIKVDGIIYPTAEHAYQACKTDDRYTKEAIASVSVLEARKIGKGLTLDLVAWDDQKSIIMSYLLRQKFMKSIKSDITKALLDTGAKYLVMFSPDSFWGTDVTKTQGENIYGAILMSIRSEINFFLGNEDYETMYSFEDKLLNDNFEDENEDDSNDGQYV